MQQPAFTGVISSVYNPGNGYPLGEVAQLVEQGTENPCVGGSIPSLAISPVHPLQALKPRLSTYAEQSFPRSAR